jgi:hypothetical protein
MGVRFQRSERDAWSFHAPHFPQYGHHLCVTVWTARVSGDLGCACLVCRHSGGGLPLCDEGL